MSAEDISEADTAPGYETDTYAYYYETAPRGGIIHIKPNKYGVIPRNLTNKERKYERAFYNLRGKSLTDGKKWRSI